MDTGDKWKPAASERKIIAKDIHDAYERLKDTAWAGEIVSTDRIMNAAREELLGKQKREYIVREVLDYDPREPVDSFWWERLDYSDFSDDEMDEMDDEDDEDEEE